MYTLLQGPLPHRPYCPARIQSASIFDRHLVRFVRFLLDPVDCLVRAGELADPADGAPVQVPEAAVGAALGTVQIRYGNPLAVEPFAFLKDLIRADFCTEVAPFTAALVDGEFHGSAVLFVVYIRWPVQKTSSFNHCRPVQSQLSQDLNAAAAWFLAASKTSFP